MIKSSNKYRKIKVILRLLEFVRPFRRHMILVFVLAVLLTLLGLVPIYLMKPLTDEVLVAPTGTSISDKIFSLNILCFTLLIVHIIQTATSSIFQYRRNWLTQKISLELRRKLYAHLQKLDLQFYYDERVGDLHARVTDDTESLQSFIVFDLVDLLMNVVMFVGIGAILFYLEWKLTIILLLPMPLIFILLRVFGGKIIVSYRKLYQKIANMSSLVFNALSGIIVIKTNVAEERELAKFDTVNRDVVGENLNNALLNFTFLPLIGTIMFSAGLAIRWLGGWKVVQGELTVGEMIVFMGFMWQFYGPVSGSNQIYANFQNTVAAAERVFKVLDAEPKIYNAPDAIELSSIKGSIKFTNVVFSYDGHKNVLEDINLEVRPGEMIGVSGRSGGGKTTLLKLICRLYNPLQGSISIDGYELRNVKVESLRKQIGIVLQDTILFYGTIAENIAYGRPDASKLEIIFAAKAAGAHDFIMCLPYAYDTLIGDEAGLSGGQKKRISIARVLIKNPRIAIFDEAESSLDLETGAFIQASIKKLAKDRNIFIISQRPSMLKMVDKLIIIDNGRIVETGTYESLSKAGGVFSSLLEKKEIKPEDIEKRSPSIYVV
ncbi:MAG: ABC transporter ATP-binding protein [Candidatus Omnitrophota bacterium]